MTTEFILGPGEEFIQCPYNRSHQITNARMVFHLEKCRKAYLKELTMDRRLEAMKICRYNTTHHVPMPELKFHEDRCSDAYSVVRHMAYHNSDEAAKDYEKRQGSVVMPDSGKWTKDDSNLLLKYPTKANSLHSYEETGTKSSIACHSPWELPVEDWEAGSTGYSMGYNPQLKLKTEMILHQPQGLTKTERKQYRLDMRNKHEWGLLKVKTDDHLELPTTTTTTSALKTMATTLNIKKENGNLVFVPYEKPNNLDNYIEKQEKGSDSEYLYSAEDTESSECGGSTSSSPMSARHNGSSSKVPSSSHQPHSTALSSSRQTDSNLSSTSRRPENNLSSSSRQPEFNPPTRPAITTTESRQNSSVFPSPSFGNQQRPPRSSYDCRFNKKTSRGTNLKPKYKYDSWSDDSDDFPGYDPYL